MQTALELVRAIIILDSDGNRIYSKYYNGQEHQEKFESVLSKKTRKTGSDILLVDQNVVVFKSNLDCLFFVVGTLKDNELMLLGVLDTLFESLEVVLNVSIERQSLLENFDLLALIVDEIVDCGIVLENDVKEIAAKVKRGSEFNISFSEKSLSSVYKSAKQQLAKSLLK